MERKSVVFAIIAAALAVMLATGIRSSFGLFLSPISEALNTGRTEFSLAMAFNSIIYGLPLVGILADKIGAKRVLGMGGLLYVAGLLLLTRVTTPLGLHLTVGGMIGVALSATTYVVVLGAVAKLVSAEFRSRAFGFITAAGSAGMFVVPPIAQWLLDRVGWQQAIVVLAGLAVIIILLALTLPKDGHSAENQRNAVSAENEPLLRILQKASGNRSYLLLIGGFFVCGFHVSFIGTHLPAYLGDFGLAAVAGVALSLIGVFNIAGSTLFGWLGDFYRKKYLLSFIYFGRAVVMALFIWLPLSQTSALVFASAMGFLWLATVPLTSGTVAHIFGTRYLSMLYGIVFLSHQVGAFLGVWLGGRFYDSTGSYQPVWVMAIVLGLVAALLHVPISNEPMVINEGGLNTA